MQILLFTVYFIIYDNEIKVAIKSGYGLFVLAFDYTCLSLFNWLMQFSFFNQSLISVDFKVKIILYLKVFYLSVHFSSNQVIKRTIGLHHFHKRVNFLKGFHIS